MKKRRRREMCWLAVVAGMALGGCFVSGQSVPGDPDDPDGPKNPDAPPVPGDHTFYAHSDKVLFKIDALTNELTEVASFSGAFDPAADAATDLALNANGELYVATFSKILRVDSETGVATLVTASLGTSANALTFLPVNAADPTGPERLIAGGGNTLVEVNLATGATTPVGSLGSASFSGDLFFVRDVGIYAMVDAGQGSTSLARLDPTTFAASLIGPTGFTSVWGLAFYGGTFYGFSAEGKMFTINAQTGAGTLVVGPLPGVSFWGAGVRTTAPATPIS